MTRTTPDAVRYYHTARTAHLERLSTFSPAWFLYTRTRDDFDVELAESQLFTRRVSSVGAAIHVLRTQPRILEVPEALAIRLWPHLLLLQTAVKLGQIGRRRKTMIVSYCMENYPADEKLREFTKLPKFVSRLITKTVASYLIRTTDRLVFATADAEKTYRALVPRAMNRTRLDHSLVWALPAGRDDESEAFESTVPFRMVFLGTFEARKGIHRLMAAWPLVRESIPEATLLLLGKSGDIEAVRLFASADRSVELVEDPPRDTIFAELSAAKALTLFSQPSRGWKEQVGLPIVEALSVGCEIVSSDETGIRAWLQENGHQVVPWDAPIEVLARSMVRALRSSRTRAEIVGQLPEVDGRLAADTSLTRAI
jgi:glycosyltransferase involved in cell wall biosynthesis